MRTGRDRTARVLWLGSIGFVVERFDDRAIDFRVVWQDATNGIALTVRGRILSVTLPRWPIIASR